MQVSPFILLFAFRYALGRCSTAPAFVVEDLKKNWNELEDLQKKLIKEEIEDAIKENICDKQIWKEILYLP